MEVSWLIEYLNKARNMVKRCEEFKEETLKIVFKDKDSVEPHNRYYCWTPRYCQLFEPIKRVVEMCDFLGVKHLERNKDYLLDRVKSLQSPLYLKFKEFFIKFIDDIRNTFKVAEEEIKREISKLDKVEIEKLDEAVHTFFEGCYYSTVAMSVCTIEHRLLKLMVTVKPRKKRELERLTLGQLIRTYLENKDEYKHVVPERHEYLLNLCNRYRISAIHPKGEEITKIIAFSILGLTFEFLLKRR